MNNETTFNPFSLLIGIFSIIASLLIMRNPLHSIVSLVYIIAIISIVEGIIKLFEVKKIDQLATIHHGAWYISIVLDILFGIILFFVPSLGLIFIWIMIALMVILNSIMEFWINQYTNVSNGGYYWLNFVLSILGLILGVVLFFSPSLAVSTALFFLSFAFMFFGITKIARSF